MAAEQRSTAAASSRGGGAQPRLAARLDAVMPGVRADLERLVRIPSVSAPGFDFSPIDRSADLVASLLTECGLETRLVAAGGRPAVLATRRLPGRPTVLLYAHHDVQPTGDPALWTSDPFEPVERDGRLYGRGAADDKAGIMVHVAALRALGDDLGVGVVVFVEGEEEYGTGATPRLLRQLRSDLQADVALVTDVGNWAVGVPAVTTSLRGHVTATLEVRTLSHAVHSGMYGGAVPDAVIALSRLIATFHDDAGDLAIAGLATTPDPAIDYPADRLYAEAGGTPFGTGIATARMWSRPSVSILGMEVPPIEGATSTLTPVARALISLRIAPTEDPSRAFALLEAHVRRNIPWGATVTLTRRGAAPGLAVDSTGPVYDQVRAALRDAWDGVDPVEIGSGGSIPLLLDLAEVLPDTTIVLNGVEDPDSRAHGIDESLHLGEFRRACLAETLFLHRLASPPPR
ncbi:M20/M25/M40 family metallo-hydrolase [Hamadaea sp. NPDC051192]|uniref:M20/M25/M40 family metallo-hydrolase n=1 Tax=Hamadaea sp. NPDC051192 TaxID=3154940 RepID=UPI003423E7DF